jgi:hypothetical protein
VPRCGASHFPSLFLTCQAKVTDLFRLLFLDQSWRWRFTPAAALVLPPIYSRSLHHLQPSTMSTSVPAPAHTPAHTLPFVRSFERGRARMVRGQRRWPRRQSAALAVGAQAPPFASLLAHATLSLSFSLCVCARARARSCPAETHRPIAATPLLQSSTKTLSPVTSCSRMRSTLTPSTTSSTRSTAR